MVPMAAYEHLVKSYDIRDLLDDIASADPPAPTLSWSRVQQIAICAMVQGAVVAA
jgi:hypothetical protein